MSLVDREISGSAANVCVVFAATLLFAVSGGATYAQAQAGASTESRSARPRPSTAGGTTVSPASAPPLSGTLGPAVTPSLNGAPRENDGPVRRGIPQSRLKPGQTGVIGPGRYVPLSVDDAPAYGRGSSTLLVMPVSPAQVSAPAFYPTTEPPRWRVVPEEHPVQAWRLVDVEDTVCDAAGQCTRVKTRLQARWVAALGGYAFRDRVGRVWRVE